MDEVNGKQLEEMIIEQFRSAISGILSENNEDVLEEDDDVLEEEEDDEDSLEEISSQGGAGGGDVGGYSGRKPGKREETLIREVYDYLVNVNAIRID